MRCNPVAALRNTLSWHARHSCIFSHVIGSLATHMQDGFACLANLALRNDPWLEKPLTHSRLRPLTTTSDKLTRRPPPHSFTTSFICTTSATSHSFEAHSYYLFYKLTSTTKLHYLLIPTTSPTTPQQTRQHVRKGLHSLCHLRRRRARRCLFTPGMPSRRCQVCCAVRTTRNTLATVN